MTDYGVERACVEVDAMVFSSDGLYDKESLETFKAYLKRWQKEALEIQKLLDKILDTKRRNTT